MDLPSTSGAQLMSSSSDSDAPDSELGLFTLIWVPRRSLSRRTAQLRGLWPQVTLDLMIKLLRCPPRGKTLIWWSASPHPPTTPVDEQGLMWWKTGWKITVMAELETRTF